MEKVGEAALSAFFQILFQQLAAPLIEEFRRLSQVDKELEKLHKDMNAIQALLRDSETRGWDESHSIWLKDLENAAYDAEDVIDRCYYEAVRHHAQGGIGVDGDAHGRVRKRDKVKRFFLSRDSLLNQDLADDITKICGKLEDIARRHTNLNLARFGSGVPGSSPKHSRETSSLISEPHFHGREAEKKEIIRSLLCPSQHRSMDRLDSLVLSALSPRPGTSDPPVVAVVGIGGIGKTALAQVVYNDAMVKNHFNIRMWVCVTDDFDMKRITGQMYAGVASAEEKSYEFWNLNTLQESLKSKLTGKRFLLVLDDVWHDNHDEWHKFRAPLNEGGKGSMILVTTRHMKVAEAMGTLEPVYLKGLSFEHSWLLMQKSASSRGPVLRSRVSEEISKKIIDRVKGVPLAVKTVANILTSNAAEAKWRDILEGEIHQWPQNEGDILAVLRLSYEHLPLHLKKCFAYCSLFPKDHRFDKPKLVTHWMANGFIQTKNVKRLEDEGSEYFDELCRRSFFLKVDDYYVMQDLFHDLALSVSLGEFGRIESENPKKTLDKDCHHLSFSIQDMNFLEMRLASLANVRTFLYSNQVDSGLTRLDDALFDKLHCLRVLDLSASNITYLPESIGNLIHLRLLDLSHTRIEKLPGSISKLYILYTLELSGCARLKEINSGVLNLINLHHLNASSELISKLPGIGKMTSLLKLNEFSVSRKEGFRIKELEKMNELRGKLCVFNLHNVENEIEASRANLEKKEYLDELQLVWPENRYSNEHERELEIEGKVLEKLCPPSKLEALSIKGNHGSRFPGWMNHHSLSNLRSITLRSCRNWKVLPTLGNLQYLTSLKMEYLSKIEEVGSDFYGNGNGNAFPSLEVLELRHMQEWKHCETISRGRSFGRLRKMLIEDCPFLENIFLPPSLKCIKIEKCPRLLNYYNFIMGALPSLTSLSFSLENSYLNVRDCINKTLQNLTGLEGLEIYYCNESMTAQKWAQKPSWMPFTFSQGRAADEVQFSTSVCNIHDGSDIRIFLLIANNFCDYPDVNRRDVCLRIRNHVYDNDDNHSLSICLQDNLRSLRRLLVKGCLNIASLLGGTVFLKLNALEKLELNGCREMRALEWFPKQHEYTSLKSLQLGSCLDFIALPRLKLTALEEMHIEYCENLVSLDLHELLSLKRLILVGCPNLSSELFLQEFTSLQELEIRKCAQLLSFSRDEKVGLPNLISLRILEINSCDMMEQLPPNLLNLSSLKSLSIIDCPAIISLPDAGLPLSLEELRIEGCPLLEERCQMGGLDFHKIANIPSRKICCRICHPYRCCCSN